MCGTIFIGFPLFRIVVDVLRWSLKTTPEFQNMTHIVFWQNEVFEILVQIIIGIPIIIMFWNSFVVPIFLVNKIRFVHGFLIALFVSIIYVCFGY